MPDALLVLLDLVGVITEGAGACWNTHFTTPTVSPREPTAAERELAALRAFEAVRHHVLYDAELDRFGNV